MSFIEQIKLGIKINFLNMFGDIVEDCIVPYGGLARKRVRWRNWEEIIHERFTNIWCWEKDTCPSGTDWNEASRRIQKQANDKI